MPEEDISRIRSVLTILDGQVVYGEGDYGSLSPPIPPVAPDWSPVGTFGGYHRQAAKPAVMPACGCANDCQVHGHRHDVALGSAAPTSDERSFWGTFGCSCWAV